MRYTLAFILSVKAFFAEAQQVNPVTDYTFANRMSSGRSTVTDTAAYFSIGPRYGAVRGMMPPMVTDTVAMSANKRNGLLIFSIQKNKYQGWDSAGAKWADITGAAGSAIISADTAAMLFPYLRKADTTAMLSPYLKESDTVWLSNRINLKVNIADTSGMLNPYLRGSGTANYFPKFDASRSVINSKLYESGTNLLFNTTAPSFTSAGITTIENNATSSAVYTYKIADTIRAYMGYGGSNTFDINNLKDGDIRFYTSATLRGRFQTDGTFRLNSLTGTGSRIVVADANGVLSATSSATGLVDTTVLSTRAWRQKGDDSLGAIIATKGSGTVTSVATGYGLSGGTITTTGTIIVDSAIVASRLRVGKVVDSLALVKQNVLTNPVTGTGTTNYVPKFTGTSTIGNSIMHDDGTRIAIGSTSTPSSSNIRQLIKGTSTNNPYIQLENGGGGGMTIGSNNGAGVQIYNFTGSTGSETYTEVVEINSDAEFQINNLSDAGDYKLQVNGNIYNTGGAVFSAASGVVRINTTTNPSPATVKLFMKGTTTQDIYLGLENGGGGGGYIGSNNGPGLQFYRYTGSAPSETSITKALEINSASELLVANASDAGDYKLQVSGNAYVTGSTLLAATSGNVGVGISSGFSGKVHVSAQTSDLLYLDNPITSGSASYAGIRLAAYDGSSSSSGLVLAQLSNSWALNSAGGIYPNSSAIVAQKSNGLSIVTSNGSGDIRFNAGDERAVGEHMRLTPAAELFVGHSGSPTDAGDYKLQVSGNAYVTGTTILAATSGTVSIGVTTSGGKLNVYDGNYSIIRGTGGLGGYFEPYSSTGTRLASYGAEANGDAYLGTRGVNPVYFITNGSNKLKMQSDGGLRFIGQSAAPTAEAGTVYYDTDDNKLKVYNGTIWVDLH